MVGLALVVILKSPDGLGRLRSPTLDSLPVGLASHTRDNVIVASIGGIGGISEPGQQSSRLGPLFDPADHNLPWIDQHAPPFKIEGQDFLPWIVRAALNDLAQVRKGSTDVICQISDGTRPRLTGSSSARGHEELVAFKRHLLDSLFIDVCTLRDGMRPV